MQNKGLGSEQTTLLTENRHFEANETIRIIIRGSDHKMLTEVKLTPL